MSLGDVLGRMPAAVMVVEARSRRIVYANARARRMSEDQLGRTIPSGLTDDWQIFHPDGRPYRVDEWPLIRSITTGEEVVDEEYFNVRADGSRLIVRCSSSPVYGEQGQLVAGVLIMHDITAERRAEEQLAYHARLTAIVEDAVVGTDAEFRLTVWNRGAERLYGYAAAEVLGRDARDVASFPDDSSRIELESELLARDRARTEFTALRKDGTPVEVELIAVAVRGERGEVTGYVGIHRDVSERKRAEEEREARAAQQALVADLGQRALASDDLQSLLDDAAALVARTLGVELAKVGELLPGGEELLIRAGVGWRNGVVGGATEPVPAGSQAGYALSRDDAVVADDLAAEQRFEASPVIREHGAVSAATVVIRGRDEPFGVLGALSTRRRSFSPSDVSFMQAVANVLATAVERRQAHERLIEVREIERRRIARDLHDEALQDVAHALALARRGEAPDELTAALERVGQQLRGAIYDLRLDGEDRTRFRELLEALVGVHRAMAADLDIVLDVEPGVPGDPLGATGIEVLRILGEALTNVRRHAGARRVRVRVAGSDERLRAEVSDDGRGFEPAPRSALTEGHGIRGMHERAALLHGRLDVSSDPASGTTVRLDVPLRQGGDGAAGPVRVLLVEDQTAVREAIASAFRRDAGFDVVGQAASLAEARGMLEGVDVAVLDLRLPDGSGADLIEPLHAVSPQAQALVLSAALDHAEIARAVQRGAAGVLDKMAHLDEVADAVQRLRAGETLLPLEEVVELLRFAGGQAEQDRQHRAAITRLTPREREVLQALADGLDSRQIADGLGISVRTERNHVASVLTKLGVHSQLQAVLFALHYGIIDVF